VWNLVTVNVFNQSHNRLLRSVTINDFLVQDNGQKLCCFGGSYGTQGAANQHGVGLGEPIPSPVGMDSINLVINGYQMK
jgi:hypothetical protein